MSPEERIRLVAARYDGDDDEARRLGDEALQRLAWRKRRSGKECARCGERKPLSAFGRDTRERDGLHRLCRGCRSTVREARLS